MASTWQKAMHYLGLGPDEDYDDYDVSDDVADPSRVRPQRPRPQRPPVHTPPERASQVGSVRTLPAARREVEGVGPIVPEPAPRPQAVRPMPVVAASKPHVISPTSFNDVQEVADKFKSSQPVIVNLQGAAKDLSRRLIDFASGLCYGLGGHMERVADQVYLLTPTNVEVSAEERRRLKERGLHDR